jgi:amidase/aspartyl-tRNA(Asn)/glutamyl-tRNA(Gln) amidotransferase subunit A
MHVSSEAPERFRTLGAELARVSTTQLAQRIRERELSAVEVLEAVIARIEERNPSLNALVHLGFDEARERARAADAALAAGEALGPLHGVPTAIKDLFDFKPGWPATFGGIPALRDHVVDARCMWAERMEAAGAIVVGKTNSPVMGFRGTCDNPLFGPTRNPFDLSRNSGGSSGGAAAAVADGLLSFAEGTDAGGSIRIPAAWCNVYGFKQSFGRAPLTVRPNAFGGVSPFIFEGLLTRTVADAALALTALSGPDPRDPLSFAFPDDPIASVRRSVRGMRIAYSPDMGGFPVDPAVAAVVDEAVQALAGAGAHVEPVEIRLPCDQRELSDLWSRLLTPLNLDALEGLAAAGYDLLGEHRDQLPPQYLRWMDEGLRATARDSARDEQLRTRVLEAIQAVFVDHELLVTPTLGCLPVPNADVAGETVGPSEIEGVEVDELIGWCLTYPINFTGHPAASVPAGLAGGRHPVGLQIVGRLGADVDVLAASAALERVRPWAGAYALCDERALS